MIELGRLRDQQKDLSERLAHLERILDLPGQRLRIEELEHELSVPDIWNDLERSQQLSKERTVLSEKVDEMLALRQRISDAGAMLEDDLASDFASELASELESLESTVANLEFLRMFGDPMDPSPAFLDIQAGSGGTEAQDWAEMLLRMYLRYAERKGFKTEILECTPGEVAGIKSVSVRVEGAYAYGWLRTETGVHRLVRKSPFDSNHRRHTSFAAVFVSPEIDDKIDVELSMSDCRIDTYRASGAGGQHVNRTDSAVRITHLPTGLVVQCQSDRSQHKNRASAIKQLRAKLYELEMKKRRSVQEAQEADKMDIGWGSQIRSYVLDDARVKDLRTGYESGHPESVLDGALDPFIQTSLREGIQ